MYLKNMSLGGSKEGKNMYKEYWPILACIPCSV